MPVATPLALTTRGIALAVALGALALGCGDAPAVAPGAAEPVPAPAPVATEASAPSTGDDTALTDDAPEAPEPEEAAGEGPAETAPVRRSPRPSPRPAPGAVESAPLPERPPMPAPPPVERPPETRTPEARTPDYSKAEAFWARFQAAVRTQDRAAIQRGLAESIRFGDQSYARSSEPVQEVITAIVTEPAARDAYLAVDRLTHTPTGSRFESAASYVVDGETYEVVVYGTVREVAPGDWRLVEVGSR